MIVFYDPNENSPKPSQNFIIGFSKRILRSFTKERIVQRSPKAVDKN